MFRKIVGKQRVAWLLMASLSIGGCTNHGGSASTGNSGGPNSQVNPTAMSAKPPVFGMTTASNFSQACSKMTNIALTNGAVSAAYSSKLNNMNLVGGMAVSGLMHQANLYVAATYAGEALKADMSYPVNDTRRLAKGINYNVGFTSGGANLWTPQVIDAVVKSLVESMTGEPPSDGELSSLTATATKMGNLYIGTANDTAANKQLVIASLIAMICVAHGSIR